MDLITIFLIILSVLVFIMLLVILALVFTVFRNNKQKKISENESNNSSLELEKLSNQKIENLQMSITNNLLKTLNETNDNLTQKLSHIRFDLQKHNETLINDLVKSQTEKLNSIEENNVKLFGQFEKQINQKIIEDNKSADALRNENIKIREVELQKRIETIDEIRKKIDSNFKDELAPKIETKFNEIKENFNNIQAQVGSLNSLSNEIKDIHKIFFSDFKTRGIAGETSFENLISDVLPSDEYEKQYKIDENKIVDFVIKIIPNNNNNKIIFLPIDSKFPSDAYLKYSEGKENAKNTNDIVRVEDEFIKNLTLKAKSIKEKYIIKNKTTDIALMFIPSEAIFTEVIKLKGGFFISEIRSKYNVEIISPIIANYVIYLIKSWHNKYEFVQGSKKYIDFITKFKKRYESFNKHSDSVLKSANTFVDRIEKLIHSNKTIFSLIDTFEKNNKTLMKNIQNETIEDGSAEKNDAFLNSQPTSDELIEADQNES